jgi:D-alanine--poly(phosphoribitol) ligase subunit 1
MHVLDRIDAVCRRVPDRVVHRSEGRTRAYAELRRRSDALAASIARLFPGDRSPIVVVGHKEPEMLVGFLRAACLCRGSLGRSAIRSPSTGFSL